MNQPPIQFAIRLVDFFVNSLSMKMINPMDRTFAESLQANVNLRLGLSDDTKKNYTIVFDIDLMDENKNFELKLQATALFETKEEISEEFKNSPFILKNSPAIAFPFVRSFVNTVTTNAGIGPIILPSFNFSSIDGEKK